MSYDESLLPSSKLASYVGSGTDMENFKNVGLVILHYLKELGDLHHTDKVLEVGCGIGRIAIPLTQFLSQGLYEGFDIVHQGIKWCQDIITPKYPNFHFHWVDIYNKTYNPNGRYQADSYHFPYSDGYFDFIFLTSVFTHMLPLDLQHYLDEISRVLKKGGTCFFTIFLINNEAHLNMSMPTSKREFHNTGDYWTTNPTSHEDGIGYDQILLEKWLDSKYFVIKRIQYGHWWINEAAQDIVVINKL